MLRKLVRSPGYSGFAILIVAVGIGVNTTTFSVMNALLLRAPPMPEPDRLAYVYTQIPQVTTWAHSPGEARDIRSLNTVFDSTAVLDGGKSQSYSRPGAPAERVATLSVSEDYFKVLGIQPVLGRFFSANENQAGGAAVISNRFWRNQLGADPAAVGREIHLDGRPVTVVGVLSPALDEPLSWGRTDVWEPLAYSPDTWASRDSWWLRVLGRLKPGVTLSAAQADVDLVASRLQREYPHTGGDGQKIVPYLGTRVGTSGTRLTCFVMGLALFILLIACSNLAGLQVARAAQTARENAVRLSLGCSRRLLFYGQVAESAMVSALGGALGLALAFWGTRALSSHVVFNDSAIALPMDMRVVAFTLLASAVTAVAFGVVSASIVSSANPADVLRLGGKRSSSGQSHQRLFQALIVAEIALALGLLSGASYFVTGTIRMTQRDLGWASDRLVVGSFTLPYQRYNEAKKQAAFTEIQTKLAEIPGVESAAVSSGHPAVGYAMATDFSVGGLPEPEPDKAPIAGYQEVMPGFFANAGIHLLKGRDFSGQDRAGGPGVVIINRTIADAFWPGLDPVGKKLGFGSDHKVQKEIVGVVNDVTIPNQDFRQEGRMQAGASHFQLYVPLTQISSSEMVLSLRTRGAPGPIMDEARRALAAVDPDVAVYNLSPATVLVSDVVENFALAGRLLSILATLGVVLAALGIFGLIANLVSQRTKEIGIRVALGAQRSDILWLVMSKGLLLTGVGTALGLGGAWGLIRILSYGLPEVPGTNVGIVAALATILAAAALSASWLPAQRAAAQDPIEALRSE